VCRSQLDDVSQGGGRGFFGFVDSTKSADRLDDSNHHGAIGISDFEGNM
jgi:hypothetical protein